MHSLSYRHLSVNKPGVWVICGMRFRWNVRLINLWKCQGFGNVKVTTLNIILNTTSMYCAEILKYYFDLIQCPGQILNFVM